MKTTTTLTNKPAKKPFSAVISGEGAQKLIRASLKDEASVKRFTGTLISVVNASEQLRNCDPGSIISAALRGEGAGLIYGQGYYVVPYGTSATYITSYKGWCQLAIATGLYGEIDCIEVREGEHRGRDRRTGKPVIDLSVYETDEERETHPVIGYKAYFELKDGYYREEYWTVDKILRHADRYSQAFSRELYLRWQNGGELTDKEQRTVTSGSPWYTSFDRMAKKTVLKSLLTSGFAPLTNEVKSLLNNEPESGEAVLPDFGDDVIPDYTVVETTGEVIEAAEATQDGAERVEEAGNINTPPKGEDAPEAAPVTRRGRKKAGPEPAADEEDELGGFFD